MVFFLVLETVTEYSKSLEYIHYRSYGIFFSYAGVALISLYSGIARTGMILIDTIVLAIVNLVLNYGLIFGKFGLPEMGIGGSGLASSIAEGVAFVVFVVYVLLDRKNRRLNIFTRPTLDWTLTRQQLTLSLPVVAIGNRTGQLGVFLWDGGNPRRTRPRHFQSGPYGVPVFVHSVVGFFLGGQYPRERSDRPGTARGGRGGCLENR